MQKPSMETFSQKNPCTLKKIPLLLGKLHGNVLHVNLQNLYVLTSIEEVHGCFCVPVFDVIHPAARLYQLLLDAPVAQLFLEHGPTDVHGTVQFT